MQTFRCAPRAAARRGAQGEDKWTLKEAVVGGETLVFAVVADGHGGAKAAEYYKGASQYMIEEANGDASAESRRREPQSVYATAQGGAKHGFGPWVDADSDDRERFPWRDHHRARRRLGRHPRAPPSAVDGKPRRLTAELAQDSPEEQKRVVAMGGQLGRLQHRVTKRPAGRSASSPASPSRAASGTPTRARSSAPSPLPRRCR